MDKRTKRGRELAQRLNYQTILDRMPELYFVKEGDRVRLGRTDWPGDVFEVFPATEFAIFRRIYERMVMPLRDATYDED